MEPAILGIVLDSSIIIEAERKRQTVEQLLETIQERFGDAEIAMSAVTLAELVHGVARGNTPERGHAVVPSSMNLNKTCQCIPSPT